MSQRDDPAETQYMIVHWRRFLDLNNPMGARLSRPCVDCIAKLCCDQQNRMGQKAGAKDIKGHSWFRVGFLWSIFVILITNSLGCQFCQFTAINAGIHSPSEASRRHIQF